MARDLSLLKHYLRRAIQSIWRGWLLAGLIILAISVGVGASMSMITVLHAMSQDPLPGRSDKLFYPHLQPGPPDYVQADAGKDFTWPDAVNLLKAHKAHYQAMMAAGRLAVSADDNPSFYSGRYVSSEFFDIFQTPFVSGSGWSVDADNDRARVVVLNGELAKKLYGTPGAALGSTVRLQGHDFRVVGVLADWHPVPLFYGGSSGDWAFKSNDQFFLPITAALGLGLPIGGGETCWASGDRTSDSCTWLQLWVELDSPTEVERYRRFLDNYWRDQRAHGRFPVNAPPGLYRMSERLRSLRLVPDDVKLQLWLSMGFLCVCLFNTVSLMLAKFLRAGTEVCIRRAMGASKRDIFLQFGTEAGVLGLAGGVLGLLFTWCGLWIIHQRPDAYAKLASLDRSMVLGTFVLSLVASIISGLMPAWRACRVPPASRLKLG